MRIRQSTYKRKIRNYVLATTPHGHVLDVGGAQNQYFSADSIRGKLYILDLPKPHTHKHRISIKADIQRRTNSMSRFSNFFDYVYCIDVAQYWWLPDQAIRNISKLMRKEANLVISFPSLYAWHKPTGKDYLRYSRDAIETLLKASKIDVVEEIPIKMNTVSRMFFLLAQVLNGNRIDYDNANRYVIGYVLLGKKR